MHPKQVPIIIALSMFIATFAITAIVAMVARMFAAGIGAVVALTITSVMLGAYLPVPFSRSLTDVYVAIQSMTQAIAALEEKQDVGELDPDSIKQQYRNIVARLTKLEELYREPSTELINVIVAHREAVKHVARILLQRIGDRPAAQLSQSVSSASGSVSPRTNKSE